MSRLGRRYQFIVLLVLMGLIISACGGDDEEATPTPRSFFPSVTPINTAVSGVASPTPIPTFDGGSFPTSTPFQYPTAGAAPTLPQRLPNNIQINSPVSGGTLRSAVTIFGSASHPDFVQYTLEYGPQPNPSNLWYPITPQAVTVPVLNGALGAWNTTLVADGVYQIRLHVYLSAGREVTNAVVSNLTVRNSFPTSTPQQTNRPPTVSAVAPFKMVRGTSATLALGIFDPDGDAVTFSAISDNTTVATVSPVGQAVTVNARNTGVATLTIRATDSRGASAQTSFIVTVVQPTQQNNPPSIGPIPSQTIQKGTVINVPLTLTDPDGDEVSFSVSSANPGIVSAASGAGDSINLSGINEGSATVTVTATDSRGATQTSVFSVVVNPPAPDNNPPSIGAIPGQSMEQGDTKPITVSVSDPDDDSLNITANSTNTSVIAIDSVSANVVTLRAVNAGSTSVSVTVNDGRGGTASTVFGVSVSAPPPPNQNPAIDPISNQTIEVGETVTLSLSLSDPDNDTLTTAPSSDDPNIATVGSLSENEISVTGVSQGQTNVTVVVTDGRGGSASASFQVNVNPATQPNQDPQIAAIADQNVGTGQSAAVSLNVSDPDGDTVTLATTTSDSSIATVFQSGQSEITVSGVGEGQATITVTASDGRGGTAEASFAVNVSVTNQPPAISAISDQTCAPNDVLDIQVNASDPNGDTVSISEASSQDSGVAQVTANQPLSLSVNCVADGSTQVNVTVADTSNATASTSFQVVVATGNTPPTIDQVGPQVVEVGQAINVTLNYSDADGDTLTVVPSVGDGNIASVDLAPPFDLQITGLAAGSTTVTIALDDQNGGTSDMTFDVTVNAAQPTQPSNNPPTIDPIGPQNVEAGQSINVPVSMSDPDGDQITVVPSSDNEGVATVSFDANTMALTVSGVAEGNATITVQVSDPNGGSDSTSFGVTVTAPAPVFDVSIYPEIPDIDATILGPIYQTGQSQGLRNNVFSLAGDDPLFSDNFLDPITTDNYDLGNYGNLQTTIDHYNGVAHETIGGTELSWDVDSAATGEGWSIDNLFNPNFAGTDCNPGEAPLACELRLTQPAVLIVSFAPANATALPVDEFRANLQQVVTTAVSNSIIPVLATLPDDGTVDAATLASYNEVIVEVATQSNVPLWNVYLTLDGVPNGVYSVGGTNATDFTDPALAFGYNRRNLATLRVLEAIRSTLMQ